MFQPEFWSYAGGASALPKNISEYIPVDKIVLSTDVNMLHAVGRRLY